MGHARIYALTCLLGTTLLIMAQETIDTTTKKIVHILQKKDPAALETFDIFRKQYELSVSSFFDRKNNDPLEAHIKRMECELKTIQTTAHDPQFKSVKKILIKQHEHVSELLSVLKQYIGSKNSVSLALKVRHFRFLLPEPIQRKSDLALFWCVHHRLACSE